MEKKLYKNSRGRTGILGILLAVFLFQIAGAQNQANIWYFRDGQGLDFSNSTPSFLQNGSIGIAEGTAAISDSNGNLQFYTDGVTVWDRFHLPMPNGNGLFGDLSSTQSALIIPQPGSEDIYYIFTTAQTCGPMGFRYSIVDMTLNGGSGDVLPNSKNMPLLSRSLEKIAGVHHCNGEDIWVVAIDSNTGEFHAWLLTKQGLCLCPVVSNSGPSHYQGFGCMKFSNDGKRMVVLESDGACNSNTVHTDLYDFDNNTGTVSFYEQIDTAVVNNSSSGGQFWGASFSPNNQILYVSTGFMKYNGSAGISNGTAVVQYDLNAANIESSATLIYDDAVPLGGCGSPMGSLQLAPDGKIYVGNFCSSNGIDVIENPDVLGLGCNYQHGINLGAPSTGSGYGITNFVESYFGQGVTPCDTVLDDDMCDWLTQAHCPVLGIDGEPFPGEVSIFPNPAEDHFTLNFPNQGQVFTLKIFDVQGRLLREIPAIEDSSIKIDRGNMGSGLYFLQFSGPEQRFSAKVWFK